MASIPVGHRTCANCGKVTKHRPATECWNCKQPLQPSKGGLKMSYRDIDCPNCGRHRVEDDGVCEKCLWDVDNGDYASITRPDEYDTQGFIFHKPDENLIL